MAVSTPAPVALFQCGSCCFQNGGIVPSRCISASNECNRASKFVSRFSVDWDRFAIKKPKSTGSRSGGARGGVCNFVTLNHIRIHSFTSPRRGTRKCIRKFLGSKGNETVAQRLDCATLGFSLNPLNQRQQILGAADGIGVGVGAQTAPIATLPQPDFFNSLQNVTALAGQQRNCSDYSENQRRPTP
jgi:hypothetical protein